MGITHPTVQDWSKNFVESLAIKQSTKFAFQDDYQIPLYNVWKLQNKTNQVSHFGHSKQNILTDKQQVFADAYLCDPELNATKAYMAAYPKSSAKSAKALSSKLLTNINLKKYIESQQTVRSKRTRINAD